MATTALVGNAVTWLSTFPRIYIVANFVLFVSGIILIMIAAINTYTKNKNITIRNIDYLLSNPRIVLNLTSRAGRYLITKAIDDAKIPHNLLDENVRFWICEPHIIGYAKSCYIVIYNGQQSNKEIYEELLKSANAILASFSCIPKNIKITPETIKYKKSQIRKSLNIVKDNLIQAELLKE